MFWIVYHIGRSGGIVQTTPRMPKLNNRGLSLIELMVTIVIVSVGGYVFATQMSRNTEQVEMIKRRAALEEIKNNLRLLALNRTAVNYSATLADNAKIKDCILGTNKCVPDGQVDFTLSLPNQTPVASPKTFYNFQGAPCAAWNEGCPIKVSAVAKAVCNRGVAQCIYAGGVYMVTKVEIFPAIATKAASYGIRDVMETTLLTLSGAQEGNKSVKNLSCPTGTFMRGVDLVNNKPVCSPVGSL
jgi:prepilin-type N-terminal cleavage/methylation domain-containing protein